MAVKSNVVMNPTTRENLQKAIILFKDIASALLPSFMNTAMGTQYKKLQQRNKSKCTTMGNHTRTGNRGQGTKGQRQGKEIHRGRGQEHHGSGCPY